MTLFLKLVKNLLFEVSICKITPLIILGSIGSQLMMEQWMQLSIGIDKQIKKELLHFSGIGFHHLEDHLELALFIRIIQILMFRRQLLKILMSTMQR